MPLSKEKRIRKKIDKKINNLVNKGKKKEFERFIKFQKKEDLQDSKFFWNLASYRWNERIPNKIRDFIKKNYLH